MHVLSPNEKLLVNSSMIRHRGTSTVVVVERLPQPGEKSAFNGWVNYSGMGELVVLQFLISWDGHVYELMLHDH